MERIIYLTSVSGKKIVIRKIKIGKKNYPPLNYCGLLRLEF